MRSRSTGTAAGCCARSSGSSPRRSSACSSARSSSRTRRLAGEPAAAPAAAPAPTVRKVVTVLFADVVGHTRLASTVDPESLRNVMRRFFGSMRTVIERHGGTPEKFAGDEVMAVFGVPAVHEDDALRAVRAADEMRAALAELSAELERDHGVTLELRIGVNTGEVVTGDPGEVPLVTGDAVNVGKRLQEAAAAGRDRRRPDDARPRPRRGRHRGARAARAPQPPEPLQAFRIVARARRTRPGSRDASTRRSSAAEQELRSLRAAFVRARDKRAVPCSPSSSATPGIGKSRLARELIAGRRRRGRRPGRALRLIRRGRDVPPLVDVVRQATRAARRSRSCSRTTRTPTRSRAASAR